jgi:polar amino acid transport system permease protein
LPGARILDRFPWWLLLLGLLLAGGFLRLLREESGRETLVYLARGLGVTIGLSLAAYAAALVIGLVAGLGRVAKNPVAYTLGTLYVELVRGVPLLVIVLYAQFVVAPALGTSRWPFVSGLIALAIGYGAYLAEVYRAGIESIERGQMEAARSLGMSYARAMRFVILPQAIRRVLPALGNDFIAMLKDSSLVSVLAVPELLQQARFHISRTFQPFEVFNLVALTYLLMTTVLSAGVRYLERRLQTGD